MSDVTSDLSSPLGCGSGFVGDGPALAEGCGRGVAAGAAPPNPCANTGRAGRLVGPRVRDEDVSCGLEADRSTAGQIAQQDLQALALLLAAPMGCQSMLGLRAD